MLFGRHITMQARSLPESDAAIFVRSNALTGRMLTWFDYGEYSIWHFSPGIRVSMDGRRETVYSDEMRALHWRIYRNETTAVNDVARLDPDYIWLPVDFPVVERLKAAGWRQIFKGSRSTLLARGFDRLRPGAAVEARLHCEMCPPAASKPGAALARPAEISYFPGP
jgi:hypothetical protein